MIDQRINAKEARAPYQIVIDLCTGASHLVHDGNLPAAELALALADDTAVHHNIIESTFWPRQVVRFELRKRGLAISDLNKRGLNVSSK